MEAVRECVETRNVPFEGYVDRRILIRSHGLLRVSPTPATGSSHFPYLERASLRRNLCSCPRVQHRRSEQRFAKVSIEFERESLEFFLFLEAYFVAFEEHDKEERRYSEDTLLSVIGFFVFEGSEARDTSLGRYALRPLPPLLFSIFRALGL